MAGETQDLQAFAASVADAAGRLRTADIKTITDVHKVLKDLGGDLERAAQALGYTGGQRFEPDTAAASPNADAAPSPLEPTPN
jgi:hypothetical protein